MLRSVNFCSLFFIPFISSLLMVNLLAAPVPAMSKQQLRRSLRNYDQKMKSLTRNLSSIEKKLENVNKKSLKMTSQKLDLENKIYNAKTSLLQTKDGIKLKLLSTRKNLMRLTLNRMGERSSSTSLIVDKVFITKLSDDLKTYKKLQSAVLTKEKQLLKLESRLKDFFHNQQELRQIIANLEQEKRIKAEDFVVTQKQRQVVDLQYKKYKKKVRAKKFGSKIARKIGLFTAPIEKKVSIDFKKKGVTFTFTKPQPVLGTRAGKVVYKGSLSTYGNIIMIDHGNETRSVLLGEFQPKVSKGTQVSEGQTLGYAKPKSGRNGKLYFEVRRKDKAQETVHLLKETTLANN